MTSMASQIGGMMARELTTLLASPERQRRLGLAGAKAALEYDWAVIARRLDALYRRVAGVARNEGDQTRLRSIR